MSAGAFVVRLEMDSGEVLRVEKRACAGRPLRLGRQLTAGEVCGKPGRHQVGTLWLCKLCFRAVVQDAEAHSRADAEHLVLLGACVFPMAGPDRISSPLCKGPATEKVGTAPACAEHYEQALAWHRELSGREQEARAQREAALGAEAEAAWLAEMKRWAANGSQVVYYLRRGDGAVKIGTTTAFAPRLRELTRQHGPLEILLTHCGDFDRETEMHNRFADLCIGGEWFRLEEPLLSWIIHVRHKRVNARTRIPGTVPLRHCLRLRREWQQMAA